jgi:hypothetical protein
MVYSWSEHVFILEHYFTSKLFAAVHGAFRNVYPDKEVQNKTTMHWLVTKFRAQEVFVYDMCWSSNKTAEIMAIPI